MDGSCFYCGAVPSWRPLIQRMQGALGRELDHCNLFGQSENLEEIDRFVLQINHLQRSLSNCENGTCLCSSVETSLDNAKNHFCRVKRSAMINCALAVGVIAGCLLVVVGIYCAKTLIIGGVVLGGAALIGRLAKMAFDKRQADGELKEARNLGALFQELLHKTQQERRRQNTYYNW